MSKVLETEEKKLSIVTWFSASSSSTADGLWLEVFIQLLKLSNMGYFHAYVRHTQLERKDVCTVVCVQQLEDGKYCSS